MSKLGVNIDHIASIRQLRRGVFPDPVDAAAICQKAGADGIVVHLREDRRHINDQDLVNLKKVIYKKFNLEMSINSKIVDIACKIKPDQSTLVPERRQELTTEGGLNVVSNFTKIKKAVKKLNFSGISVSLFIDPDIGQIRAARDLGIENIELHTGQYANARSKKEAERFLQGIKNAVLYAKGIGINVFAGHGLDYENIAMLKKVQEIEEYNIGYSIISEAVFVGLERAVKRMKSLVI